MTGALAPGTRRKAGLIQALGSPEAASWIRSPSENNAALRSLSGRGLQAHLRVAGTPCLMLISHSQKGLTLYAPQLGI